MAILRGKEPTLNNAGVIIDFPDNNVFFCNLNKI